MTHAPTSVHAEKVQLPDATPLDNALQQQLRCFDQVIGLHTVWLTSWLVLQADCWRRCVAGSQPLPPWMVWHNGTEQLG